MRLYLTVAAILIAAGLGALGLAISQPRPDNLATVGQFTPSAANIPMEPLEIIESEAVEVPTTPIVAEDGPDDKANIEPAVEHSIKVLSVPFTSQAPYADWSMPYQEACEEASMIMVSEYLRGNKVMRIPQDEANALILELVEWETTHGYKIDLTAAEVVEVLSERYQIMAQVIPYDAEIIRREIRDKRPVIIPAAGQKLGNPYFTPPGPLYHMLVVKGYEGEEFIVNDPGTKRGESYRYDEDTLSYAVHDWNGGAVEQGEPLMIIIKGEINSNGTN